MKILKYHGSNNFSYKTCNLVIYQNIILKIIIEKKQVGEEPKSHFWLTSYHYYLQYTQTWRRSALC